MILVELQPDGTLREVSEHDQDEQARWYGGRVRGRVLRSRRDIREALDQDDENQ